MIDHAQARSLAAAVVDFRLTDADRSELSRHSLECDPCRRFADGLRTDAAVLAGLPDRQPPARLLLGLERAIERGPTGLRMTPRTVLLVAMLLLLATMASLAIGSWFNRTNDIHLPGLTWHPLVIEEVESAPGDLFAGRQGYVLPAIGTLGDPRAWFSADGEAWERATFEGMPAGDAASIFTLGPVFAAGDRLLAFAYVASEASGTAGSVWQSSDGGRTWAAVPDVAALTGSVHDVTAFRGGYVAVGSAGVWTSADGANWSLAASGIGAGPDTSGEASDLTGVTTNAACMPACGRDERLFAVGGTHGLVRATFWTSMNGVTWERQDQETVGSAARRVADTPRGLVAVGHRYDAPDMPRGAIWVSTDGISWANVPLELGQGSWDIMAIAAFGDGVLVIDGGGYLARSTDLVTWAVTQIPMMNARTVLFDPALQVDGDHPAFLLAGAETVIRGMESAIRFYIGRLTLE
jgi:hypothetical protein